MEKRKSIRTYFKLQRMHFYIRFYKAFMVLSITIRKTYARLEPCRRQPVRAVRRKAGCAGECLPFAAGECAHACGEKSPSLSKEI